MFLKKKSDLRVDLLCFFCFQFEFINNIWHFSNISFSFNNITFLFYLQFWLFDLLPPANEKTTVEGEGRFCGPDLQTYGCLPPIRVLSCWHPRCWSCERRGTHVKSKSLKLSSCKVCFIRDRELKRVVLIILAFVKNKFLVALNLQ